MSDSATPWTAAPQASLSFTISWSLLKPISIELVMPSNHLILYVPFSSCLQSLPASGSFPMSWLFTPGDLSIGASFSASVLPMNIQGWFPLGWTGLIPLLSKGLSRILCSTTIWKTSAVLQRWQNDWLPFTSSSSHCLFLAFLSPSGEHREEKDGSGRKCFSQDGALGPVRRNLTLTFSDLTWAPSPHKHPCWI